MKQESTWLFNMHCSTTSILHSTLSHVRNPPSFMETQDQLKCSRPRYWTYIPVTLIFWHRSFTFNSNKSPTWCNNFSVYYPDVCLQLNMFRAFTRPSSGAQWLWPARPRTQHDYHHDTKVKPEVATAVIKLLMMGGKTPKTCWAVNKRQDNKLKKLFHQVGDLFELNVKLRCQKLNNST